MVMSLSAQDLPRLLPERLCPQGDISSRSRLTFEVSNRAMIPEQAAVNSGIYIQTICIQMSMFTTETFQALNQVLQTLHRFIHMTTCDSQAKVSTINALFAVRRALLDLAVIAWITPTMATI